MIRWLLCLPALLAVAACSGAPVGPSQVSTQYPPNTSRNALFQTLNSMPPGTANLSPAPNATAPDYASMGFRTF